MIFSLEEKWSKLSKKIKDVILYGSDDEEIKFSYDDGFPYGFREYDARWLYEESINKFGITNLGKGLGTQIINHTKKIILE